MVKLTLSMANPTPGGGSGTPGHSEALPHGVGQIQTDNGGWSGHKVFAAGKSGLEPEKKLAKVLRIFEGWPFLAVFWGGFHLKILAE